MPSLSPLTPGSQSRNFSDGTSLCKSCGSANLIIKLEPPHYALRCQACGAWQSWIRKSEARRVKPYRAVGESIGADVVDLSQPPDDLRAEVDELRKRVDGLERELTILIRVEANYGLRRVRPGTPPEIDVDDELVSKFVEELRVDNGD